ncbi:hypothetical protein DRO55_04875, partial [Candidatus Bathyarchaeota archaeon]
MIIDENTTLVNWALLAAQNYAENELGSIQKDIEYLSKFNVPVAGGYQKLARLEARFEEVFETFSREDYALGAKLIFIMRDKIELLRKELNLLRLNSVLTALAVIIFSYGFGSLTSVIITEDKRKRFLIHLSLYFLMAILFIITQPYVKLAFITFMEKIIPSYAYMPYLDVTDLLLSCFIFGSAALMLLTVLSLKLPSFVQFVIRLGVRHIKARIKRITLTLITISIIVGATVIFINITSASSIIESGRWEGRREFSGLIIEPKGRYEWIKSYEVEWIKRQDWSNVTSIRSSIISGTVVAPYQEEWTLISVRLRYSGISYSFVDAIGIDPDFAVKFYNLHTYITPQFLEENDTGILIPETMYDIPIGAYVEIEIYGTWFGGEVILHKTPAFVKGKFNPKIIASVPRIDGKPLFGGVRNPENMIIYANGGILKDYAVIDTVTVITNRDVDVKELARNLAFLFGKKVTANDAGDAVSYEEIFIFAVTGLSSQIVPIILTALIIFSSMFSVIYERRREIDTLAVVGGTPKNVLQIFMIEALIIGLFATFIGYFGSYIVMLIFKALPTLLGIFGLSTLMPSISATYLHWSFTAVIVAILSGTVVTLFGSLIPCARAQNLSLLGREKKRDILEDVKVRDDVSEFSLPLKIAALEGEILYVYLKKCLDKDKIAVVKSREIFQDGTFKFDLELADPRTGLRFPMTLEGTVREGAISPVIKFPTKHKHREVLHKFLYQSEKYIIDYRSWKERYFRVIISR